MKLNFTANELSNFARAQHGYFIEFENLFLTKHTVSLNIYWTYAILNMLT